MFICAVDDMQDNCCHVEFILKVAKRCADVALSEKLEILVLPACS